MTITAAYVFCPSSGLQAQLARRFVSSDSAFTSDARHGRDVAGLQRARSRLLPSAPVLCIANFALQHCKVTCKPPQSNVCSNFELVKQRLLLVGKLSSSKTSVCEGIKQMLKAQETHLVHVLKVVVIGRSVMSSTVCEYERMRLQRMRDNQLRLKELGIKQAVSAMEVSKGTVKVAARYCRLAKSFGAPMQYRIVLVQQG